MTPSAGKERISSRRFLIVAAVLFLLLIAAFAGTVTLLNSTVYSASGFVRAYLDDLARHDVAAALATPGVGRDAGAAGELLTPAALGDLDDVRLVSDTAHPDGLHRLVYSYRFGGTRGTSAFSVVRAGVHMGFFSAWRFRDSPLGTLRVTPLHAAEFTANGIPLEADQPGGTVSFRVLTPAAVVLAHHSTYFAAAPKAVLLAQAGTVDAQLDIRANKDFVAELQKQLDAQLKDCTTQKVLLPTGCPFGQRMANRIEGDPVWSMARYPKLTVLPGGKPGEWQVPQTAGAAHLKVKVRSLFDGTLSTFDEDVPFTVSYTITFSKAGTPTITAQG